MIGHHGHAFADVDDVAHTGHRPRGGRIHARDGTADHRALGERGMDHARLRRIQPEQAFAVHLGARIQPLLRR